MSIERIMNLNDDQMVNMYDVTFPNGIPGAEDSEQIALRCDQSVDVPEDAVSDYEIFYKGMKIPMPGKVDESAKEITLTVRLDQQWQVYDDLKNYKEMVYNSNTGTAMPISVVRTVIAIEANDGQHNVIRTILLRGSFLKSIKITAFEPNGTDPSRLELIFRYTKLEVS